METFRSIRWKFFFKDVLKELDKLIEKVKDQGKDVIKPKKDRITKLTTEIDTKISNIDKNIKSYTDKNSEVPKYLQELKSELQRIKTSLNNIAGGGENIESEFNRLKDSLKNLAKLSENEKLASIGAINFGIIFVILAGILTAIIIPSLKHKKKKH